MTILMTEIYKIALSVFLKGVNLLTIQVVKRNAWKVTNDIKISAIATLMLHCDFLHRISNFALNFSCFI